MSVSLKVWVESSGKKGKKAEAHIEKVIPLEDLGITIDDWSDDNDKYYNAISTIPGVKLDWGTKLIHNA